ncbi:MAG: DUF3458 domain-containing protein, partial [Xanthomonadales bacterium]|nr:DUF3458 domain-containing protein [Xanthomonadales bacterium]
IRPDQYQEINNFYTATVYQKGATVIRMYHTLLGEEGFQRGMRLYFERHDGQAVTCDDFLAAMADANGVDLSRFARWYSQSGTPEVTVEIQHDRETGVLELELSQRTPPTADQRDKQPLVIPFAVGLLAEDGSEVPLQIEGSNAPPETTQVLVLEEAHQSFRFVGIHQQVVPSLLRDFSAPVKVRYEASVEEMAHLIAHDPDVFARWEAAQSLAQRCILAQVDRLKQGEEPELSDDLVMAFRGLMADESADPVLVAESMTLPAEGYLAEQMNVVDVDGIHQAREFIRSGLAKALKTELRTTYEQLNDGQPYSKAPEAMARRKLKNLCLSYLVHAPGGEVLASSQLNASDNMTDTLAALKGLVFSGAGAVADALSEFERKWRDDSLVMDKWFAIQAMRPGAEAAEQVTDLLDHPRFSIRNPNKVRSVIGVFGYSNPTGFHAASGSGYRFIADQVIALDAINPQVAARMAAAFNRWYRYDEGRKRLMRNALERISEIETLSTDTSEIVENALKLN